MSRPIVVRALGVSTWETLMRGRGLPAAGPLKALGRPFLALCCLLLGLSPHLAHRA